MLFAFFLSLVCLTASAVFAAELRRYKAVLMPRAAVFRISGMGGMIQRAIGGVAFASGRQRQLSPA
jgi:hypothetical protein